MQTRSPHASNNSAFDAGDMAACRALLSDGSRTFLAASFMLPRAVRDPACALYAFCRQADDAVDSSGEEAGAVLTIRERLEHVYGTGRQAYAADRALAQVVRQFAIPSALPHALLEGFEWDAAARRYETIEALHEYAARVAGSVGAMMALVMGARSPLALARACDLGVAMQLSNIARDVGEDARMGRLYLPTQWMVEAGVDPDAWLAKPEFTPAIAAVVARLLAAADALYARADAGVSQLPLVCRPGINAARFLYAAIGHQVARSGLNSVERRAVVGGGRKAMLLALALLTSFNAPAQSHLPALPATQFLIDAVTQTALVRRPRDVATQIGGLPARAIWLIDLFERLERRDRIRVSAR